MLRPVERVFCSVVYCTEYPAGRRAINVNCDNDVGLAAGGNLMANTRRSCPFHCGVIIARAILILQICLSVCLSVRSLRSGIL